MNKRLQIMESAPVGKALAYLGLPTIVGLSVTGFYQLAISYFVAQLGTQAMGAISIVYPLTLIMPGIGLLFGNGGAAYIAELLGAGEKERAETVLASTLFYCLFFSVLTQFLLPILPTLLVWMGASSTVLPLALEYAQVLVISFLFHMSSVCMMNLVRAEGNVALSTVSQMTGAILNIILAPIFIFWLDLGIRGAAMATATAQAVAFFILLQYYVRKKSYLKLDFRKVRVHRWILEPVLRIGVPLLGVNLFQSISMTGANIMAAPYGDSVVAGLGIANRVIGMTTLAINGFSRGYQTFISYSFGAGYMDRIRQATRKAYTWGMSGGVVISAIQILFAVPIASAFSEEPEVVQIASKALVAGSILFATYGLQAMATVYLLCVKYNWAGFVFSICRQGIVYLPLLLLFERLFQVTGIFYTQAAADALTTVVLIVFLFLTRQKRDAMLGAPGLPRKEASNT